MALSYKARRRWSLVILILGLPAYIVAAVTVVNLFERPHILLELAIYIGLGVLWAIPLKSIFKGIGQADPNTKDDNT
ncbi:DUF2842 domain-containing protein [Cochlodiniinecator piscidefendens]|uniref:DUF2842 domain-containing protein n=1 Tax=Cochlodiniinecator piscidefendens TaxID=2715756 RepID=UPI00140CDC61|nr:DUF2842 domain-containing protein [Cochlodiniinecator piscidefendens]